MSAPWPTVKLGEVLAPIIREHVVDPVCEYPLLGVRLDGQGPFHRETVLGTQTSASRLYEVRAGDFIYSRLFAWRGAFGLIENDLDGHFVSNEFPTFTPVTDRLDLKFLRYWFRLPDVLRRVEAECSGSTPLTRNRYKEEFFLSLELPLPSFDVQRRIVVRIEKIAGNIEEARRLRSDASKAGELIWTRRASSIFSSLMPSSPPSLESVAYIIGGQSLPESTDSSGMTGDVHLIKVSDMNHVGNEIYIRETTAQLQADSALLRSLRIVPAGAVILPKRGGAIATNKKRILTKPSALDPNLMAIFPKSETQLSIDYLYAWLRTIDLASMQDGTSVPQINKSDLAPLWFPLVPLSEQRLVVAELCRLQSAADQLTALQHETARELDAIMPAVLNRAFRGEL